MDCCWTHGVDFPGCPEGEYASPCCHASAQCVEMLGRTRATYICIRAEPRGPEEPSISDSEAVTEGDNGHYETVGPCLAVRPIVQQTVTYEQLMASGGHPQWTPSVTGFTTYILRWSWLTWVRNFSKI